MESLADYHTDYWLMLLSRPLYTEHGLVQSDENTARDYNAQ